MNNTSGYIGYQLKELLKGNLIGSVFTDPNNPEDFIAGYVQSVGAKSTLVASITPYGQPDGFFGVKLPAVLEVQYDNAYAERLQLLMRLNNVRIGRMEIMPEEDAVSRLFMLSLTTGCAVTLWTATESYPGFVTQLNDLFVEIQTVDFMGERCPPMSFRLIDIEMVSIGSEEERMYEKLDNYHHEKKGGR